MTSKAFPANMVANLATQFVGNVTIYTNQGSKELLEELTALLKGKTNIKIDDKAIKMLKTSSGGPQVVLEDGEVDTHAFLVHAPNCAANASFATSLGLELSESGGEIKVTPPFHKTNVPGVFAVGDVASFIKAVSIATAAGSLAGVGVSAYLLGL
jgi:thioredoxin reductase